MLRYTKLFVGFLWLVLFTPILTAQEQLEPIDQLEPGESGKIYITDSVACLFEITGESLCTEAFIWTSRENRCVKIDPNWSQASLEVSGECVEDSLFCFKMKNTGEGDMQQASNYRIFNRTGLLLRSTVKLDARDSLMLKLPANPQTTIWEANQVPFHPQSGKERTHINRCGENSINPLDANFVARFPPILKHWIEP